MFRRLLGLSALISLLTITGFTNASEADDKALEAAQEAAATRAGIFKLVRMYFGPMYGMARQQIPFDAALVERNAGKIAVLATMIPDAFRQDTTAFDISTGSLPGIWANKDDFMTKAGALNDKAQALAVAAAQGEGAFGNAFGEMGAACKACHDDYREE